MSSKKKSRPNDGFQKSSKNQYNSNKLGTNKLETESDTSLAYTKVTPGKVNHHSSIILKNPEPFENEELIELKAKGTQTPPSHKDQASSTGNHLRNDLKTKQIANAGAERKPISVLGKMNEMTTQADFEELPEESHAETQTESETVLKDKQNNTKNKNHIRSMQPKIETVAISSSAMQLKSKPQELVQSLKEDPESIECDVSNYCFPEETEYNDLELDQLVGVAKEYLSGAKQFGWYFLSQCLEFMNEDTCNLCTHPEENQATTNCDETNADQDRNAIPHDCNDDDGETKPLKDK